MCKKKKSTKTSSVSKRKTDGDILLNQYREKSETRDCLLKEIIEKREYISEIQDPEDFLMFCREWNSWYPSTLNVNGGCYILNLNGEIILIDPGFNTIEFLKTKNLDIRCIRHIFITHLHPDHTENLVKIITRTTTDKFPINLYLNSTSFHHFKIYARSGIKYFELKPNMDINLEIKSETMKKFDIECKVYPAFHLEAGGAFHSISLKFRIFNNLQSRIISFLSDTDGKYFKKYVEFFEDSDIIVPHLGSLHGHPTGFKHLYLDGLNDFLEYLPYKASRIIVLSEFGFELTSDQNFAKIIGEIIPIKMKFKDVVFQYHLNKRKNQNRPKLLNVYYHIIGNLLEKSLIKQPHQTMNCDFIIPIIFPEYLDLKKTSIIKDTIKETILEIKNNRDELNSIIFDVIKWKIIFKKKERINVSSRIDSFFTQINAIDTYDEFNAFFANILQHTSQEFILYLRKWLSTLLLPMTLATKDLDLIYSKKSSFHRKKLTENNNGYIDFLIQPDDFKSRLYHFNDGSDLHEFHLFLLPFYIRLFIIVNEIDLKPCNNEDLRGKVLQAISKNFNHRLMMAHPSYKIIFKRENLFVQGFCRCEKTQKINLDNTCFENNNFQEIIDGKKEEFVPISFVCVDCDGPTPEEVDDYFAEQQKQEQVQYTNNKKEFFKKYSSYLKSDDPLSFAPFMVLINHSDKFTNSEISEIFSKIKGRALDCSPENIAKLFKFANILKVKEFLLDFLEKDLNFKNQVIPSIFFSDDNIFMQIKDDEIFTLLEKFFLDCDKECKKQIFRRMAKILYFKNGPFEWYANDIYPEQYNFVENVIMFYWFNELVTFYNSDCKSAQKWDELKEIFHNPNLKKMGVPFRHFSIFTRNVLDEELDKISIDF